MKVHTRYLLLVILTSLLAAFVYSCKSQGLPECDPDLVALMLTEDDFPESWSNGSPHKDDEYSMGAIDSCMRPFYTSNGSAGEEILRFKNEDEAIRGYDSLLELFLSEESEEIPTPSFVSPVADNFHIICTIPRITPMCRITLMYGQFIVDFDTHFRPEFMTQEDLVKIIQAIDEKMLQIKTVH